jgi:hypothetical protein
MIYKFSLGLVFCLACRFEKSFIIDLGPGGTLVYFGVEIVREWGGKQKRGGNKKNHRNFHF